MTLEELHAKQRKDLEAYRVARDQSWQDMKKGHTQIIEAVGGITNVPDSVKQQMAKDELQYNKEWTMYVGERHQAMLDTHKKEREAITGKSKYKEPSKAKEKKNPLSDQQQDKLTKIIAQQQAIRKRN